MKKYLHCSDMQVILVHVTTLKRYNDFAKKLTDQIERRLLQGESIGASEKIYSIFEEHTE